MILVPALRLDRPRDVIADLELRVLHEIAADMARLVAEPVGPLVQQHPRVLDPAQSQDELARGGLPLRLSLGITPEGEMRYPAVRRIDPDLDQVGIEENVDGAAFGQLLAELLSESDGRAPAEGDFPKVAVRLRQNRRGREIVQLQDAHRRRQIGLDIGRSNGPARIGNMVARQEIVAVERAALPVPVPRRAAEKAKPRRLQVVIGIADVVASVDRLRRLGELVPARLEQQHALLRLGEAQREGNPRHAAAGDADVVMLRDGQRVRLVDVENHRGLTSSMRRTHPLTMTRSLSSSCEWAGRTVAIARAPTAVPRRSCRRVKAAGATTRDEASTSICRMAVFVGTPAPHATWSGAGRLPAAAVEKGSAAILRSVSR